MMKYAQCKIDRREGMILLLVVAVLVLLALMGTVYILTASTDKQVSYATNDQANLGYATQGALSIVRADILNTTLGPSNTPLALGSQTPARVWTGPDIGYTASGMIATPMEDPNSTGTAPSTGQPQIASQPWLCGVMPFEPDTNYQLGTTVLAVLPSSPAQPLNVYTGAGASPATRPAGAYEPLISVLTPALYDPADGAYDISFYGMNLNPSKTPGPGGMVRVPNASVVMPAYQYDAAKASASALSGAPPLIPFGTRDAMWNMLPYSSPNGTHYRFAVRIMDLSAMMNVNTGWIADATSPTPSANNGLYAATGAAMASYPIYTLPGTYNSSDPSNGMQASGVTPPTRAGTYAPSTSTYGLLNWQQELAYYENQGIPNTNNEYLNLYGAGTELQWLAYGGAGGQFGLLATNRLGTQMQNTFGTGTLGYGTGYQSFYTTYSWSRQYASASAPATNTPASLNPGMTELYPSRVNLNASVSASTPTSNGYTLAAQIANALATCRYNQDHACEYAANYFSYRYGVTASAGPNDRAWLTTGSLWSPVICSPVIGSSPVFATGALPVASGTYFIGNTAQPFINEVEITLNAGTVEGYGVELYNPYNYSIDISGWQIQFFNGTVSAGAYLLPTGTTIAAGKFLVIYNGTVPPVTGPALASLSVPPLSLSPTSGYVVLEAPCLGLPSVAGITAGFGAVDATGYTNSPPAAAGTYYMDISRSDSNGGYQNAIPVVVIPPATPTPTPTLGAINVAAGANGSTSAPYVPLYNRSNGDPVYPSFIPLATNNYQILNWADANCIARECSTETTGPTVTGTYPIDPITWKLGSATLSSIVTNDVPKDGTTVGNYNALSNEQQLAQLYFDFPFDPRAALPAHDMPTSGPVVPNVLTMFSLNARADDPSVTPVGVAYANLLTRTPGLLNVNTAGEVPLYDAIYDAAVGTLGTTKGPALAAQLEADTIAYRDRLATQSNFPLFSEIGGAATVTATGTTPNDYSTVPGYNIKSLGDLLYAWLQEPLYETDIGATPTSFLQRDALWAACANNFCVHSDTFAVYGLIQAIRLNPNYVSNNGTFNITDWYNANQYSYGNGASGPNGTSAPGMLSPQSSITTSTGTTAITAIPEFILEGQRRFVAIVDSSYSTPSTTGGTVPAPVPVPKIVAIKYLPQ